MKGNVLQWYALYVKSRHEFATEHELQKQGVVTYLPAIEKVRQWKDRKKYVNFPLFPGYIFVRIVANPEEYLKVLKIRGAVMLLSHRPGYPAPIPSGEIESLRKLVESGEKIDIYPQLKEGERIRIKRGPLKDAEGYLTKKESQYVFIVNIELLGRSIAVQLYGEDLEVA